MDMQLIASSAVQLGLTSSCPASSTLSKPRRLGRASPFAVVHVGRMSTTALQHWTGVKMWQNMCRNRGWKPVKVSQRSGKSTLAHVSSQQSNPCEGFDGRGSDSTLRNLDTLQKRRLETLLPQAFQAATGFPGTHGIENPPSSLQAIPPELLQGTEEWMELRKNRITASSFGNALGFWGSRRVELWEEKIGIREPFAGNEATRWGSTEEAGAIEKYKSITGNRVDHVAFKIYQDENDHLSWLGASPDGLITYNGEQGSDEKLGILEVKCPHNKGKPELGSPWDAVPYYYIPQAQGLLEIFDREHMDFYVWTLNGSSVFRIERNRDYWGLIYRMMAGFWWGHVIPAKCALEKGKSIADIQAFRPVEDYLSTERIVTMSRHLAQNSRLIVRERNGLIQQF